MLFVCFNYQLSCYWTHSVKIHGTRCTFLFKGLQGVATHKYLNIVRTLNRIFILILTYIYQLSFESLFLLICVAIYLDNKKTF